MMRVKVSLARRAAWVAAALLVALYLAIAYYSGHQDVDGGNLIGASCDDCFVDPLPLSSSAVTWPYAQDMDARGAQPNDDFLIYGRELQPALSTVAETSTISCRGDIVFVVMSCAACGERRETIRRTWASMAGEHNASVYFAVGWSHIAPIDGRVRQELADHQDVLRFNFTDSYRNLTIKVIAAINYARLNCPSARFVVKVDDDIYYNLPLLVARLNNLPAATFDKSIIGFRFFHREQFRRHPSHKLYIPPQVIANDQAPNYLYGWLEIYHRAAIDELMAVVFKSFPLLMLEDVLITGFMAERSRTTRFAINNALTTSRCDIDDNALIRQMLMIGDNCDQSHFRRLYNILN